MLFLVHFPIILMSIALSHGIPDTYDPIPILYYPVQNIYRVSSIPVVEQMVSKSAANKPTFLSVLFLCGDTKTSFFLTVFQLILPLVYLKQNIWEQIPKCRRKPYLHLIDSPSVPGSFTTAIGYKIADTALDNIRQYRLSSESLQIAPDNQDKYGVAIFYYKSALFSDNTYAAMHHFHAYNHLLISSTTCEKYNFKLMMDKKARNIDFGDIEMYFDEQHQQKLFNRFEIPLSIKWREKYPEEPEPEKEYFVPHKLVPTNDFVDDNERIATCITANIIPVWSSISKGPLKRVEKFIQKLAAKLHDNTLTVYTITQDILLWYTSFSVQGTPDKEYKARISKENVYLNFEKEKIPVPRYILKIIGYRVPFTKTSHLNNRFQYYMIIVIQNELFGDPTRLCNEGKEPICKKNGWHVTSEEDEDNNVYCCCVTDRFLQDLSQNYQISGEIFNLNKTITLDRLSINPTEDDVVTEPKKEDVNKTEVTARQPEEDNATDKTQVAESKQKKKKGIARFIPSFLRGRKWGS